MSVRIQDKLATYNQQGGLECAVCRIPVKPAMWTSHIKGSLHIEKINQLHLMLQRSKIGQNAQARPSIAVAPAAEPIIAKASETKVPINLVGYGSDSDEDSESEIKQNDMQEEEEEDYDIDIEVPEDFVGDPDDYIEAELERRRQLRSLAKEPVPNVGDDHVDTVEFLDEENRAWRWDGTDFVLAEEIESDKSNETDESKEVDDDDSLLEQFDSGLNEELLKDPGQELEIALSKVDSTTAQIQLQALRKAADQIEEGEQTQFAERVRKMLEVELLYEQQTKKRIKREDNEPRESNVLNSLENAKDKEISTDDDADDIDDDSDEDSSEHDKVESDSDGSDFDPAELFDWRSRTKV